MNPDEIPTTEEFTASTVHLFVSGALADYPALKKNAHFKQFLDAHIEAMILQITTWCLSGMIPTRIDYVTISEPVGVWQMFKREYMPHWFTARFPVRTKDRQIERTIHTYFVCPHLVTAPTVDHVKFMATGTPGARGFGSAR